MKAIVTIVIMCSIYAVDIEKICQIESDNLEFYNPHTRLAFNFLEQYRESTTNIGAGASGSVRNVRMPAGSPVSSVAVKRIPREAKDRNQDESIAKELEIIRVMRLVEAGPKTHACLFDKKAVYIIQELFTTCLKDDSFKIHIKIQPIFEKFKLIEQIFLEMIKIWRLGYIHGDIKPENMVKNGDGKVTFIDFGVSQSMKEDNNQKGTPIYMSDNKWNESRLELESDLYAAVLSIANILGYRDIFLNSKPALDDGLAVKSEMHQGCFKFGLMEECVGFMADNVRYVFEKEVFSEIDIANFQPHIKELAQLMADMVDHKATKTTFKIFFNQFCKISKNFPSYLTGPIGKSLCPTYRAFLYHPNILQANLDKLLKVQSVSFDEKLSDEDKVGIKTKPQISQTEKTNPLMVIGTPSKFFDKLKFTPSQRNGQYPQKQQINLLDRKANLYAPGGKLGSGSHNNKKIVEINKDKLSQLDDRKESKLSHFNDREESEFSEFDDREESEFDDISFRRSDSNYDIDEEKMTDSTKSYSQSTFELI